MRKTHTWSGHEGDGGLPVTLMKTRRCLCCSGCNRNDNNTVECHMTDDILEDLDEHQAQGYPVPDHVNEGARRDQAEYDKIIQRCFDQGSVPDPQLRIGEPPKTPPDPVQRRELSINFL
jgi:hypothetical protein